MTAPESLKTEIYNSSGTWALEMTAPVPLDVPNDLAWLAGLASWLALAVLTG